MNLEKPTLVQYGKTEANFSVVWWRYEPYLVLSGFHLQFTNYANFNVFVHLKDC